MRVIGLLSCGLLVAVAALEAQAPGPPQQASTMRDLMVSLTYPAANDLLLFVYRGAPKDDKEWAVVQKSATLLVESGNLLKMRGPAQGEWTTQASALADVGAAAYKAARAKDAAALATLGDSLNATCVSCHRQYRPNVHPSPR